MWDVPELRCQESSCTFFFGVEQSTPTMICRVDRPVSEFGCCIDYLLACIGNGKPAEHAVTLLMRSARAGAYLHPQLRTTSRMVADYMNSCRRLSAKWLILIYGAEMVVLMRHRGGR